MLSLSLLEYLMSCNNSNQLHAPYLHIVSCFSVNARLWFVTCKVLVLIKVFNLDRFIEIFKKFSSFSGNLQKLWKISWINIHK